MLPGTMDIKQQWQVYEQKATEAGHRVSQDDWRLSTNIYLADSMAEAVEDIREGVLTEARQYFFNTGGKPTYEAYLGQPADEITFEQIVERRQWIIGDPDYCAHRIKQFQEATGGFGGLLMVAGEWTTTRKWYRSLELFARYVMPQFKGTLRGIQNSYRRMIEDNRLGRLPVARSGALKVDAGREQSARQ